MPEGVLLGGLTVHQSEEKTIVPGVMLSISLAFATVLEINPIIPTYKPEIERCVFRGTFWSFAGLFIIKNWILKSTTIIVEISIFNHINVRFTYFGCLFSGEYL